MPTPTVLIIYFLSVLGIVLFPLAASWILQLFSRLFKFQKKDFRTALYCIIIILLNAAGLNGSFSILFLDQYQKFSNLFFSLTAVISLIVGTYVLRKFYGASALKSFFALLLTGLTFFIGLVLLILLVGIIFLPYTQIK